MGDKCCGSGLVLYATLRGCISVGDALIDVCFLLLGLSYSLAYTYKVSKKLFFSFTVDFKFAEIGELSEFVVKIILMNISVSLYYIFSSE